MGLSVNNKQKVRQTMVNPTCNLYGANLPPDSFLLQLKNGWRSIAETLWLLLLACYTSFEIIFDNQGPKLLPW